MTSIDPSRFGSSWWLKADVKEPDECWPWRQSTGSHGYGQTWDGVSVLLAHRVAWTLTLGPIPDGMTIDHLCRNRICVNPAHLRLLTNVENARLNGNAVKVACKYGHPFTPTNTIVTKKGHRKCRECARLYQRSRASTV